MGFEYNSELDILTVEKRDYDNFSDSVEFANFVVDFTEDGEVLGVEVVDASEATPLEKEDLERISEVECRIRRTDEFIEISLLIYIDGSKNIVSSNFPVDSGMTA